MEFALLKHQVLKSGGNVALKPAKYAISMILLYKAKMGGRGGKKKEEKKR